MNALHTSILVGLNNIFRFTMNDIIPLGKIKTGLNVQRLEYPLIVSITKIN